MAKQRLLSLPQVQGLNDKDFVEYLEALLQLSTTDPEALALSYNIWGMMSPEQRIIMLKYMGDRATPQGRA